MSNKTRIVTLVVAAIIVLDQVTKIIVVDTLHLHQSVPVIESFFHLVHVRNTGAAFSLFADMPAWFRQPFFFIATGVAVVALLLFLRHTEGVSPLFVVAVAAILGGALGNLIDRIRYGEVIDFVLLHWRGYHWPAFNVADACITLGVIGLLWSSMRENRVETQRHYS
ncbi:MAG: signal peptidase II [Candidatus Binatia bacterium]